MNEDDDDDTTTEGRKPRYIDIDTFKKWKHDLDKEFNTVTWLECETVMASGKKMVRSLKCDIFSKCRIKIESSRNFGDRWIVGAKLLHTTNIRDNGRNNQDMLAMLLLMKERATSCGEDPSSYTPIVQASL